jgi:hypothetical protein
MNIHVVTPNKKGFSGPVALAKAINGAAYPTPKQGSLVYGESTVGAGLPILSTLRDLLETGDEIIKIEGVFSGTLSYIFNEFSKVEGGDVKFSEVVKIAKDKGYTVRSAAIKSTYLAEPALGTRPTRRPLRDRRRPKTDHPYAPMLDADALAPPVPPPRRVRIRPDVLPRARGLARLQEQGGVRRAPRRG